MRTIKAIQQVLKRCSQLKKGHTFQAVRLCAATDFMPAHVYATDGINFGLAIVDDALPDALVPSEPLKPLTKFKGNVEVTKLEYGVIEFKTSVASTKVQGMTYDKFPTHPTIPEDWYDFSWQEIKRVLYASAQEKYEPHYAVLNFTEEAVEAHDTARFARVVLNNLWTGLVSAKLFKAWPGGKIFTNSDGDYAFFKIGDEIRTARKQLHSYPDTATGIPLVFRGNSIIISATEIKTAIECSIGVSAKNYVRLEITPNGLIIYPFGSENRKGLDVLCSYANTYQATIPILFANPKWVNPCTLDLDAKYVYDALKQINTANLILGYGDVGDSNHPLRIESGNYTACIWQLVV